jgi:hypothetical protein
MINLHNTLNASKAEGEMTAVSNSYRNQFTTIIGGEPEKKAAQLFTKESRGKAFHTQEYLRLKPRVMAHLEEISTSDDQESAFNLFKSENNLDQSLSFGELYMAIRTYELGSKLQEINQKRKIHGGNEIFTSILSIAGDIATFFPADGGITAGALKGSSAAIKGGLAAGKFLQQQSRNKGWFGADTDRS